MWLPKPVYELLPYGYLLVGAGLLLWSFVMATASVAVVVAGVLLLVLGLTLWLKRRDYRTGSAEYNPRSLDD